MEDVLSIRKRDTYSMSSIENTFFKSIKFPIKIAYVLFYRAEGYIHFYVVFEIQFFLNL